MNEIEIIDDGGGGYYSLTSLRSFIDDILDEISAKNWNMGVLLTNNTNMRAFNRQWRNIDAPTDVLSFVQGEGDAIPFTHDDNQQAGDIIVSMERIVEQALDQGIPEEEELRRVIIHGILHLNGMDHPNDDYNGKMLSLQEELLAKTHTLEMAK